MADKAMELYAICVTFWALGLFWLAAFHKRGELYGFKHLAVVLFLPVIAPLTICGVILWSMVADIAHAIYKWRGREMPQWVKTAPGFR